MFYVGIYLGGAPSCATAWMFVLVPSYILFSRFCYGLHPHGQGALAPLLIAPINHFSLFTENAFSDDQGLENIADVCYFFIQSITAVTFTIRPFPRYPPNKHRTSRRFLEGTALPVVGVYKKIQLSAESWIFLFCLRFSQKSDIINQLIYPLSKKHLSAQEKHTNNLHT